MHIAICEFNQLSPCCLPKMEEKKDTELSVGNTERDTVPTVSYNIPKLIINVQTRQLHFHATTSE